MNIICRIITVLSPDKAFGTSYVKGEERIKTILFDRIEKGVFSEAKFDSVPELILARVLEQDSFVKNWLRPAPCQFDLTYNRGQRYIPDFVVETESVIYLVEVKGEDKLKDADVLAKKSGESSIAGRPVRGARQMDTRNGNTCSFHPNRLLPNRLLKS